MKLPTRGLYSIVPAALVYLAAAFICADFNISNWLVQGRFITVALMLIVAGFGQIVHDAY
jgi:hypothetical protein